MSCSLIGRDSSPPVAELAAWPVFGLPGLALVGGGLMGYHV